MKKLVTIFSFAALIILAGGASAQSRKECSVQVPAEPNVKSRGVNQFHIDANKMIEIPQVLSATRGSNSCYLVVDNITNEDINVFVDSVYVGFVTPGKKGYISKTNGYSIVHCWNVSGQFKWVERGDCKDCKMTYVLKRPE